MVKKKKWIRALYDIKIIIFCNLFFITFIFFIIKYIMKYISERFNKLVAFDKIRLLKIAEMSQYAFFYVIIAFILGYFTDKIFPKRDEETKTVTLIVETIIQSMVAVITVFYIRKIVKLIPFALKNISNNYVSYNTSEYGGEIIIALVFVGVQSNLLEKIILLHDRLSAKFNLKGHSFISK